MNEEIIIGCLPGFLDAPGPDEQENPQKEKCPECSEDMWISEGKRKFHKEHPGLRVMCLICLSKLEELATIKLIDLKDIN